MEEKNVAYWVKQAYEALHEAERLADETGEGFDFSPAYGMGGWYVPPRKKPMTRQEAIALIASGVELTEKQKSDVAEAIENNFDTENDDWENSDSTGWQNSSSSC